MRFLKDYARRRWPAECLQAARIRAGIPPRDSPRTAGSQKRRRGKTESSFIHFTDSHASRGIEKALLLDVPGPKAFEFHRETPPQLLRRRHPAAIHHRF